MVDEGPVNTAVGHRTGLLERDLQWSATGDTFSNGTYQCTQAQSVYAVPPRWVAQQLPMRQDFIAWLPAGYVPASIVFPRWHYKQPPGASAPDLSQPLQVTMTRDGTHVATSIIFQSPDIVVWEPADFIVTTAFSEMMFQPRNDITFNVTISQASPAAVIRSYAVVVFGVDHLAFGWRARLPLQSAIPTAGAAAPAAFAGAQAEENASGLGALGPAPVKPADWGNA